MLHGFYLPAEEEAFDENRTNTDGRTHFCFFASAVALKRAEKRHVFSVFTRDWWDAMLWTMISENMRNPYFYATYLTLTDNTRLSVIVSYGWVR